MIQQSTPEQHYRIYMALQWLNSQLNVDERQALEQAMKMPHASTTEEWADVMADTVERIASALHYASGERG